MFLVPLTIFSQSRADGIDSLSLANQFYQQGNFKQAKEILLNLEIQEQNIKKAHGILASIYEQEENVPKSLKYYLSLCQTDSLNGIHFRKAAKQFLKAGATADGLDYYELAYERNPHDFLTIKSLADIYIEQYDTLKASKIIDQAMAYDIENLSYRLLKAKLHYKQSDYATVVTVLDSIKAQLDLNSYYSKMLGFCKLKEGDIEDAIFWLQKSLSDDSESEHVHYYLSEAFSKKGDNEASLYHLDQALETAISERTGRYYRNKAKIYDEQKDLRAAINAYEEAYRYDKDPLMLYFLARASDIYYADKNIAIRYYDKYLKSRHNVESYKHYAKERRDYLKEQLHFSASNN